MNVVQIFVNQRKPSKQQATINKGRQRKREREEYNQSETTLYKSKANKVTNAAIESFHFNANKQIYSRQQEQQVTIFYLTYICQGNYSDINYTYIYI